MSTTFRNNNLIIQCDECNVSTLIPSCNTFHQALGAAKNKGWILHYTEDGWLHFCGRPCRNVGVNRLKRNQEGGDTYE